MTRLTCKFEVLLLLAAFLMILQQTEQREIKSFLRQKRQNNDFLIFSNGNDIFSNRQGQLDPNGFFPQPQQNQNQLAQNPFFQQQPNQNQFGSNPFFMTQPTQGSSNQAQSPNNNNNNGDGRLVFINNRPTIATMAPFVAPTTPSPSFLACFNNCATTPQYNPICGSNQQLYFNEQKFNCARSCGADIQIVGRGSCEGLVQMQRG